jgi:hypothetical protein
MLLMTFQMFFICVQQINLETNYRHGKHPFCLSSHQDLIRELPILSSVVLFIESSYIWRVYKASLQ